MSLRMVWVDDTARIWIAATGTRFDLDRRINTGNRECAFVTRVYYVGCIICIIIGLYLILDPNSDPLTFMFGMLIGIIGGILGAKARGAI